MEIEITQEEYERYLKFKNNKNKYKIKNKFKIGDTVKFINQKTEDIYIVDFYYFNEESYNRKEDNKLIKRPILYYIIHNKDTNIKYTVKPGDIVLFKQVIYSSEKYQGPLIDKYTK